ncbi:MAG TPA: hypothetical protein VM431_12015 [Phycisphaerae bacterium]|nr:hypothetical protein [Phycisphaerae bacterium]
MKKLLLLVGLLAAAAGCAGTGSRAWQRSPMPTHDRQMVFEAAREVIAEHFEVTEASFVRGTIETRPQVFDRKRGGTLADVRGAGGRWRRTVSFEMGRDGLAIVAAVAVRLEREATEAAVAMSEAAGPARADELPSSPHGGGSVRRRQGDEVWVEVGSDDALARELLSTIAERVGASESGNQLPEGQSPQDAAEEVRRIGAQQGR